MELCNLEGFGAIGVSVKAGHPCCRSGVYTHAKRRGPTRGVSRQSLLPLTALQSLSARRGGGQLANWMAIKCRDLQFNSLRAQRPQLKDLLY